MEEIGEIDQARDLAVIFFVIEPHHWVQVTKFMRLDALRIDIGVFEFRDGLLDNINIVWIFKPIWNEQNFHSNFLNSVSQFLAPIGRVDIDENKISKGGGKL